MKNQTSLFRWVPIVISIGLTSACSTTGGKEEPALNHASANRDLKGNVSDVSSRVQGVFKDMGISLTGTQTKDAGKEQDLTGKAGDKSVAVELNDIGDGMTHVQIAAKEGTFQWSEDYANQILSKVIAKS